MDDDKAQDLERRMRTMEAAYPKTQVPTINHLNVDNIVSRPACILNLTSDESVNSATIETVVWDSASLDTDSMWHSTTATRMTIRTGGIWHVGMQVYWTAFGATANRVITSVFNGSGTALTDLVCRDERAANNGTVPGAALSALVKLEVGDWLEGRVYQDSGGAEDLESELTRLWAYLITPD